MTKFTPTILIDSREQQPWTFTLPTEAAALDAGDYSVKGLSHLVALERKSLPDLLTCIGRERDRFCRELQRLAAYRYRMLVIEADHADLERGDWRSRLQPSHVLGSLASWISRYALPVYLAGNRESAAEFAQRFFVRTAAHLVAELRNLVDTDASLPTLAGRAKAADSTE
jgi:DNA excision repair protein ERCC-4